VVTAGQDGSETTAQSADRAEQAQDRAERAERGAEEAEAGAQQAERGAEQAERGAEHAEQGAEQVEELIEKFDDADDPLLDTTMHEIVAEVDEQHPFGVPGPPMNFRTPFWVAVSATFGVLLVVLLAESVVKTRSVLVLIAVSAFLAIGLNPMVEWLQRRHGIGRRTAVALISLGFLLFFAGAGLAVAQPIANQGSQLANGLPAEARHLRETNKTFRDLDKRFQLVDKITSAANSSNLKSKVTNGVIGAAGVAVNALFNFFTILILTLYFLANYPSLKRTAWRIAPRSRRPRVALLGDEILRRVGGYVLGNLVTSIVIGVVTFVFLLIIGVPNAAPIALFVAIFDIIPLVGATIAGIVIVVIALFHSLTAAIATLIFYVLYQQFENYVLVPRVMKKTVDVSPLTTIVAALLGGALLGIVGALVAIPIAAAVQLITVEVIAPRQDSR
jgi:predicted PurR-regulated permease PerM